MGEARRRLGRLTADRPQEWERSDPLRELRELAYMGATVLHDEAIFPVRAAGIPVNIRDTNQPDHPGTLIVPTEQYIEASYIDELRVRYVTISSDSSLSARNSGSNNFANTCSARTDNDAFLAGPLPVSDEDHAACVADIIAREPICRGGNWLDP